MTGDAIKRLTSSEAAQYWNDRWAAGATSWDIGEAAPALCAYLDQYQNIAHRVLIPGCGNAHEARYLYQLGFRSVTLLDISAVVAGQARAAMADMPEIEWVVGDFFAHQGAYDLILEQTFFCALAPAFREAYVAQMARLLKPGGRLAGLLFNRVFDFPGPPFGGNRQEYESLFAKHFRLKTLDVCRNSIKPRAGNELFFIAIKSADAPQSGVLAL